MDRLDYTKGIEPRLMAYKEMLAKCVISVPECVMVQIAVPTRDNVPAYYDEREQIERLSRRVERRFRPDGCSGRALFAAERGDRGARSAVLRR